MTEPDSCLVGEVVTDRRVLVRQPSGQFARTAEHRTSEDKLYICAVKDVFSGRIVGYSIDSRMKSRLAVTALNNAVARRGDTAGCVVHTDRGSQFRSRRFVHALNRFRMVGSMGRIGAAGDNAAMESFFSLLQRNVWTGNSGRPANNSGSRS